MFIECGLINDQLLRFEYNLQSLNEWSNTFFYAKF